MIARWLSSLLEPHDRDAVLGDLQESGAGELRSCAAVAGLLGRRHLSLWKSWRPWAALFGFALPGALFLHNLALTTGGSHHLLYWVWTNYADLDPAMLAQTPYKLSNGIAASASLSLMLWIRAWLTGFALASLSPRTLWLNAVVIASGSLGIVNGFGVRPGFTAIALAVPAAFLGIRHGLAHRSLRRVRAVAAVLLLAALTGSAAWAKGWMPVGRWNATLAILTLAAHWPVVYALLTSHRTEAERN